MQSPTSSLVTKKNSTLKVIVIAVLVILFAIFIYLFTLSGYGKCKLGQDLQFQGTRNEQCVNWGTIVDPISLNQRIIRVTKSTWNGWSESQPEDVVQDLLIDSNSESIQLYGLSSSEVYRLNIGNYDNEKISLNIDGLSLKQGEDLSKSGIDLNGCTSNSFEMKIDEKVELNTCSMDAGITWTLEYL
jgi:hypothetical protein